MLTAAPAVAVEGSEPPQVSLALLAITPSAPRPGDILAITVRATNDSDTAIEAVRFRLRVSQRPLLDRGSVDSYAADGAPDADGPPRRFVSRNSPSGPAGPGSVDLAPGASTTATLELDVTTLGLTRAAAYPMAVQALGVTSAGLERLAQVRTFLPFVPTVKEFVPTSVAWLLPLTTQPARDPAGRFLDDTLAASITQGGRLVRLLGLGAGRSSLTWAVDPALLEDLVVMSRPYQVRAEGGELVDGTGTAGALAWLSQLRKLASNQAVSALPYGAPDLVALTRHGMTSTLTATLAGSAVLAPDVLARPLRTDLAWSAEGHLDQATGEALRRAGARSVLVNGRDLAPVVPSPYTLSGRARVAGIDALIADPVLTDLAALDTRKAGSATLGVQRFLAETLTITGERPGDGRSLLIAPPLRWNPERTYARELLGLTDDVPWLSATSVADLRGASVPVERTLAYPGAARAAELSGDYLDDVKAAQGTAAAVRSLLADDDPEPVLVPIDAALLRATSALFRPDEPAGRRLLGAVRADLGTWTRGIRVVEGTATLPDADSAFPVTLVNDLDRDVTVSLVLRADTPRLRLPAAQTLTVPAGRSIQVPVAAQATVTGDVEVTATLRAPNGAVIGEPTTIVVRLTKIGRVALVLVVGASAVLFGAVALRLGHRLRSSLAARSAS